MFGTQPQLILNDRIQKFHDSISVLAASQCGFMIACRGRENRGPIGFSFLAVENGRCVALHGFSQDLDKPLTLRAECSGLEQKRNGFVRVYLSHVAHTLGLLPEVLQQCLLQYQPLCAFTGFVDKEVSSLGSNHVAWRALVGRIAEISLPERVPAEIGRHNAHGLVISRLRAFSKGGQHDH